MKGPKPARADKSVWERKCSGLLLIGSGIPQEHALTLEAIKAIQACRTLFVASQYSADYYRRWCSDVRVYSHSCDEILSALEKGRPIGFLAYGHPLLFAGTSQIVEQCRSRGVPVSVVGGISAIDAVLAATGTNIDKGQGFCSGDLHFFDRIGPQAATHLLVYRPCESKALYIRFLSRCARMRFKTHPVALIECGNGESIADTIRWSTLAGAARLFARMTPATTLLVPPL